MADHDRPLRRRSVARSARARNHIRRAFTLVEVMVAGIVAAMVLGSVTVSLGNLGRAKNTSKMRFDAAMRADAALNALRRDVASVIRTDDLFYTRVLITDGAMRVGDEAFDRDELALFNTRLRTTRNLDFAGQGTQWETQYRIIQETPARPLLWQRSDFMPDEFPLGGGDISPAAEGILGLSIEAYDGSDWYEEWDSDDFGLPLALRITVLATGSRLLEEDELETAPRTVLRTIVPIDRVAPPRDIFIAEWEEREAEMKEEEAAEAAAMAADQQEDARNGGGGGQMIDTDGDGVPDAPAPGAGGGGGRPGDGGQPGDGGKPEQPDDGGRPIEIDTDNDGRPDTDVDVPRDGGTPTISPRGNRGGL